MEQTGRERERGGERESQMKANKEAKKEVARSKAYAMDEVYKELETPEGERTSLEQQRRETNWPNVIVDIYMLPELPSWACEISRVQTDQNDTVAPLSGANSSSGTKGPSININVHHNPNNVRKGGGGKSLVRF